MVTLVPPHPVAAGPLAVRWLSYELPPQRAGATASARVELENAGLAAWTSHTSEPVCISYHWLDERRNPIVWEGIFTLLPGRVGPGETLALDFPIAAPMPPGRYRLAIDLLVDGRCWFEEVGNPPLELALEVKPRIPARTLAVAIGPGSPEALEQTREALARQEEPLAPAGDAAAVAHLVPGCLPASDWSRRILDAHAYGYAVVAGSVEPVGRLRERRALARALAPWAPGGGRRPDFREPLLCPSVAGDADVERFWLPDVEGLPALSHPDEPWLYDARIRMRLDVRSARKGAGRAEASRPG